MDEIVELEQKSTRSFTLLASIRVSYKNDIIRTIDKDVVEALMSHYDQINSEKTVAI